VRETAPEKYIVEKAENGRWVPFDRRASFEWLKSESDKFCNWRQDLRSEVNEEHAKEFSESGSEYDWTKNMTFVQRQREEELSGWRQWLWRAALTFNDPPKD